MGSGLEWVRSPEEGHGNPLQYSCLENPMNGGDWWATVQRVAQIWPQLPTRVQQQDTARWVNNLGPNINPLVQANGCSMWQQLPINEPPIRMTSEHFCSISRQLGPFHRRQLGFMAHTLGQSIGQWFSTCGLLTSGGVSETYFMVSSQNSQE